jgi:peptidoglycan/xylan/chitin deacetylase (PgdA/CDA1 family)
MRAATTIAKAATRLTAWLTRLDRNGNVPAPVVLCYHRVLPVSANSRLPRYAVTPAQFHEQMLLLADEGFRSLTLDDFRAVASGERECRGRSVLITFDDGFADIYLNAWPIAQELGIKLNLFLCTGLAAGEQLKPFEPQTQADRESQRAFPDLWRPLNWSEVRAMSDAGVSVGFHSHSHSNYGRLSHAEIDVDVIRGSSLMEQQLGRKPVSFAFPYGHHGSYSAQAISALEQHGLDIFFTTEMQRTALPTKGPISRLVVHPEDDIHSFRRKLFGGYEWVGKLRRMSYVLGDSLRRKSNAASQA